MSARRVTLLALVFALILVVGVVAGVGAAPPPFYVSAEAPGTTSDGLDYGPEDIIYRTNAWYTHFDGSAYGFESATHEIDGFHIDGIQFWTYMTFNDNRTRVNGIDGWVFGQDVIVHDDVAPGSFYMVFDGSDVGLTEQGERLDALYVIYADAAQFSPYGSFVSTDTGFRADPVNCPAGEILMSPVGRGKLFGFDTFDGQQIQFSGEDVLWFCAQNLGENTTGYFQKYFDGTGDDPRAIFNPANPMPNRSLTAMGSGAIGPFSGNPLWFFTRDTFIVPNATGGANQLYNWNIASGLFANAFFNADTAGLNGVVTGMHRWPEIVLP
jgi:hypothetical protein